MSVFRIFYIFLKQSCRNHAENTVINFLLSYFIFTIFIWLKANGLEPYQLWADRTGEGGSCCSCLSYSQAQDNKEEEIADLLGHVEISLYFSQFNRGIPSLLGWHPILRMLWLQGLEGWTRMRCSLHSILWEFLAEVYSTVLHWHTGERRAAYVWPPLRSM